MSLPSFLKRIFKIKPKREFPVDFDEATKKLYTDVQPFTMTSKERIFSLRKAVEYIVNSQIPGDVVECGVWRGGSMMAVARTLMELKDTRTLYLFDTFEGMSEPTKEDVSWSGSSPKDRWTDMKWTGCTMEDVRQNMLKTGYAADRMQFVKGKVEDTIPANAPAQISLLRLDTDWYESTYHELKHLYSRLSVGGVLIIDDYGHWDGARKAVDQFIAENKLKLLLNRIDYTARICVKTSA